ncbi:hypothetical protein SDRG_06426 [Saprolegnia diclina VS20]|uniref:PUM-HD domain-containing protein n=1 Tax=Saprolegnia diclina (strain VS20) TaxID=1156394 RepID=T0QNM1_SAPDV|nr:hypothetical protein SDRG_06426 [Saprolegnia diclina VS20]EQC36321.1 hypothetical protein SDRG_06426 [Saprolegnia diclina VS20]|eukprot:XP_008610427.1 hypothetical protein SDRG_06426 [Saprolegnia diclina VS20]
MAPTNAGTKRPSGGASDKAAKKPKFDKKDGKSTEKKPFVKKPFNKDGKSSKEPIDYKLQRKMNRPHYEVVKRAKEIWNIIRERNVEKPKRTALCDELYGLVQGKIYDVAAKHDASRVIQSLLKFGSPAQRSGAVKELQPYILELSKMQYGYFLVQKMLKYGGKDDRALIVKEMTGHVVKLGTHNVAANILEAAHEYLQPRQLSGLKLEFYGKEFALFKGEYEAKGAKKTLADIVAQSPSKKEEILLHVADILNKMIDKQLLGMSYVQSLLLEYMTVASADQVNAMVPNVRDAAVALLATRNGAKVVTMTLALGNPKDRKRVIKTLKDKVLEATNHISGYLVIMRVMDVVDDTVLVQKSVLSELHGHWHEVALHPNGAKLLLQLLSPLNSKYLGPDEIALLQPPMIPGSDGEMVVNYKKDPAVRRKELWKGLQPTIEAMCTEHAAELLRSKMGGHVLYEVLKATENAGLLTAVAAAIVADEPEEGAEPLYSDVLAHKHLQRMLKDTKLSAALLSALSPATIGDWAASNRGAFVLVAFLEHEASKKTLLSAVKAKKLSKEAKAQAGTKLLLEKLDL